MTLAEQLEPSRLLRTGLMLTLGIIAIYIEAAPLGFSTTAHPSPDLVLCLVVYWSIRRPGSTPVLAVFALGLLRDMLTDMPIGAGALTLVLVSEIFKARRGRLRRAPFIIEWLWLTVAAFASAAVLFSLLVLTFAQPPYAMDLVHQCLFTALAYPLMVLLLRWGLWIGWRSPERV